MPGTFLPPVAPGLPRSALASTVVLLVAGFACFGCGEDSACDSIGAPAAPMFQVVVLDSVTGAPAWWRAHGIIADGGFQEELSKVSTNPADSTEVLPLLSTVRREGRYTVRVERPGYATWSLQGQEVRREGCFLSSYYLEARLQRLP